MNRLESTMITTCGRLVPIFIIIKKPCIGDKPTFFAMIPSEKETAKYPSPTGILSLIPLSKAKKRRI